ncbi:MAG: type IV pili twitching motility protein PilT, partial [Chromatiaceae bacterium]|nr:type IV pili twitching motility protein PilT [Chromatiaceae bacterium]
IRKGEVHKLKELMKKSREQGMVTFDQSLFDLYEEGEISYQDALRLADSANEVRLMIKLHGTRDKGVDLDGGLEGIGLVDKDE